MIEVKSDVVDSMALGCVIDLLKAEGYDMQMLVNKVNSYALKAESGSSVEGVGPQYKSAVINRVSDLCGKKPKGQ